MAIDAVNRNETILKDYEMKLLALDGQCSGDMVLKSFIDYIRLPHFNRMVGILGICLCPFMYNKTSIHIFYAVYSTSLDTDSF